MDIDITARLARLEQQTEDLTNQLDKLKTSSLDHHTRLVIIENNLALLRTIHDQIDELKVSINNQNTRFSVLKKRVDIYVGVALGVVSTITALLAKPAVFTALLALF